MHHGDRQRSGWTQPVICSTEERTQRQHMGGAHCFGNGTALSQHGRATAWQLEGNEGNGTTWLCSKLLQGCCQLIWVLEWAPSGAGSSCSTSRTSAGPASAAATAVKSQDKAVRYVGLAASDGCPEEHQGGTSKHRNRLSDHPGQLCAWQQTSSVYAERRCLHARAACW